MAGQNITGSYRDLRVWKEAMELAAECYRLTKVLPRGGAFDPTAQMRRAAASVAMIRLPTADCRLPEGICK